MLLPPFRLLITVTFSTPTGRSTHNPSMHYETGMTPSSPEAMKMDSRVPGVDFARGAPGRPTLYVVV
jgi:hypothetical protein